MTTNRDTFDEIDATLDQLIANAELVRKAHLQAVPVYELEFLKRAQESLMARLIEKSSKLTPQERKIEIHLKEKRARFKELKAPTMKSLKSAISKNKLPRFRQVCRKLISS